MSSLSSIMLAESPTTASSFWIRTGTPSAQVSCGGNLVADLATPDTYRVCLVPDHTSCTSSTALFIIQVPKSGLLSLFWPRHIPMKSKESYPLFCRTFPAAVTRQHDLCRHLQCAAGQQDQGQAEFDIALAIQACACLQLRATIA